MGYDLGSLFGGAQATAGYPNTDYPALQLNGPASLQPKGGSAEIAHNVTPQDRKHVIAVIAVVVIGGYLLWHLNFVKG